MVRGEGLTVLPSVKLWFNGQEYVKRELAKEGIADEEWAKGNLSCASMSARFGEGSPANGRKAVIPKDRQRFVTIHPSVAKNLRS